MITYVDTSTLLKLVVQEAGSDVAEQIWTAADGLVAVGLIEVEARAALAAARRTGRLTTAEHQRTIKALRQLLDQIDVIEVTATLITSACTLSESHGLRGCDAVHLAASILVEANVLTSADTALCEAASSEGLSIANPISS